MKSTKQNGSLIAIDDCYLSIPGFGNVTMHILPDLGDSKSASYNDEVVMGRSSPLKTYSHSDTRAISCQIHLHATTEKELNENLRILRAVTSLVYPRDAVTTAPFLPPPVCQIKCGELLASKPLCVVLKSYSVKFPTDVPWDEKTKMPWKLDIDTNWDVVYKTTNLPGQEKIMNLGG